MRPEKGVRVSRFVWGLMFIALGSVLMLDRMNVVVVGSVWRLWPVGIIATGVSKLVQHQGVEGLQSGLWLLVLGAWFLIINFGLFGWTFRNSWPILAVAFGSYLVWQALMPAASRQPSRRGAAS